MAEHGRIQTPSISFLQGFEAILEGKCAQYTHQLGGLAQSLTAMIRIYQITSKSREGPMVSRDIILTLCDQFIQEVTIM